MKHSDLGAILRELKPGPGNPRNSEGDFIQTKNGDILFVYSRFKLDDPDDDAPSDLYFLRSTDGGKSFPGEPQVLFTCEEEKGKNIMSVSLLTMANGDLGVFYLNKEDDYLVRLYLRRSADDGKTWSERTLCTTQQGCFVVNNDRVVRLASGRLIAPAAVHRKGYLYTEGDGRGNFMDYKSDTVFFISDDDGCSWRISQTKCCMPFTGNSVTGLQEPGVIELQDNILWAWARTDLGRQFEMFSLDGGDVWTTTQPSRFTSSCSPLSMKRLPNGNIIAIWNPIPGYNGRETFPKWTGGRNPLVYAISTDNGKTFSDPIAFESEEGHGYCYISIFVGEDAILLGYCAGGQEDGSTLCMTRIRRIPMSELEGNN